jgi:DNA-binding transcriptional LysR family regulator
MSLLVSAADEGSFSAAGRKLGVSLPTISRKVADLETHLKTRLLTRSGRKLGLTEAGVAYVESCRRILMEVAEAESRASGEYNAPRGELIITAPVVLGRLHILPVVSEFLAAFAEIRVRMVLTDRNLNLEEDQIDVAVRIGELPDNRQVATRVGAVRRVVCGSPAYFAAHGVPRNPEDLVRHLCVTFSGIHSGVSWLFASSGGARRVISPLCRLYVNSGEAAVAAAVAGLGVTNVISYQAARAVQEGKLKLILSEHEPVALPVHLLHSKKGRLPYKMRHFLEFAAPRIRRSLSDGGVSA